MMADPLTSDGMGWVLFTVNATWALFVFLMVVCANWPLWMFILVAINLITAGVIYKELAVKR